MLKELGSALSRSSEYAAQNERLRKTIKTFIPCGSIPRVGHAETRQWMNHDSKQRYQKHLMAGRTLPFSDMDITYKLNTLGYRSEEFTLGAIST